MPQIKESGADEKYSLTAEYWWCSCGASGTAPYGKSAQDMATSHFILKHGKQRQEEERQREEAFVERNRRSMGLINQIRDKNETFLLGGPAKAPGNGKVRR